MGINDYIITLKGSHILRRRNINTDIWAREKAESFISHVEMNLAAGKDIPCAHIGAFTDEPISWTVMFKDNDAEQRIIEIEVINE